jgi:hypothetical protein
VTFGHEQLRLAGFAEVDSDQAAENARSTRHIAQQTTAWRDMTSLI